jgi:hypothetical protein
MIQTISEQIIQTSEEYHVIEYVSIMGKYWEILRPTRSSVAGLYSYNRAYCTYQMLPNTGQMSQIF